MISQTVLIKTYTEPEFCKKEILRYAGCNESTDGIAELIDSCIAEVRQSLTYKVCYREFPALLCDDFCNLGFINVKSADLRKNLAGCHSIVLFGATIGLEIDRLIAKYGKISPTKALIFQAIGAERIEALCDLFCKDIAEEKRISGFSTKSRFSAGYGDLPITLQKDIFKVLDSSKQIGLSLNSSMLMSPSKSVTAIIGITEDRIENQIDTL